MYDSLPDLLQWCLDPADGLWKRRELDWMLEYFKSKEDYEKCARLRDMMQSSGYVAPPDVQRRLNAMLTLRLGGSGPA